MNNERNIAILDYGIGNVKSISNALSNLGARSILTSDPVKILSSDMTILPGVGAFGHGMQNLRDNDLVEVIDAFVKTGKPFLGICLGMQMLFDSSSEFGYSEGLGLISGEVAQLELKNGMAERLPHVSWNELNPPSTDRWDDTILCRTPKQSDVYFVHSFVGQPENENDTLATASYGGIEFCAAVQKENVTGTQFHPEKSGRIGLDILKEFIRN